MRKFLFIFILFLNIVSSALAQDILTYKLDNGQTVIIEQVKNNPIVTIDTWIRTGSINEDDSNSGISHFLEHLFFKGTKQHPTGEFDKILESKGAITNAATSKDFTHYYITISSKYFDEALELHADMLLNPQIPRNEMEKERKVVLEEIAKDANTPSSICYENLNKLIYTTHPYKRKVIGSSKFIENVSRETILDYYKKYYTPSNMITIIVGDVDPNHALNIIKKNFNSSNKKNIINYNRREFNLTSNKKDVTYINSQSGYMMIGYRGTDINNKDSYALDILATILGDGRSSKLYQSLKEQKQLVNSISAYNSTMKEDGLFIINSNFIPHNAQKVENAIFAEIKNIKTFGISEADLKIAKKIIETDTFYSRESVSNIAKELGYITTLTGDISYYKNYLSNINKVSISDVKRVANKYLNKYAMSLVLPENKSLNIEDAKPVKHSAKLISSNKTTSKYIIDNNSTLLLTDSPYNDIVAMSICVKGGNFYEPKRGTSLLFSDLLLKGTNKYSAVELANILEENGINISFSQNPDVFCIKILTTKNQVDLTLDILANMLNNSSFDDIEIEKSKNLLINKIIRNNDDPLTLALDGYKSLIYKDSVYSKADSLLKKSIPYITKNDIKLYQSKILNPNNIIISVNGNVDKDLLIDKFGQIFIKKSDETFDFNKHSIPKLSLKSILIKKLPKQQTAWMIYGWQTSGNTCIKECASMQILNTILGSGMGSRLFESIREQDGLAYQVGSSFASNKLASALCIYVGTNPKNTDIVKKKIITEIERLKTQFVSEKELKDAKDRLLGIFVIELETNLDKANAIGLFEAYGQGYDFLDKYIKVINSVSVSDIVEVANKYLNSNYVESVVTVK